MTDLRNQFRALDDLGAPDLWSEIQNRALTQGKLDRPVRWAVLVLLLLLLMALGATLLVGAGLVRLPVTVEISPTPSAASEGLARGAWTATGTLGIEASNATRLLDGTVLVVGVTEAGAPSSKVFQPSSGTWTETRPMDAARWGFTATVLSDGRVLVAGGYGNEGELATAEVFDPTSETWTATGNMISGRFDHTATLLPNGQVLVVGGNSSNPLALSELYDPVTGAWTATGIYTRGSQSDTAILLRDGRVLLVDEQARLYNSGDGTWTETGAMVDKGRSRSATLLPDGRVLVVGGLDIEDGIPAGMLEALAAAELFDPRTGTWTATGSLSEARYGHTATLLLDGTVLVAGGVSTAGVNGVQIASAEIYDLASGSWRNAGSLGRVRNAHSATLLLDGTVLVAGGYGVAGGELTCELYHPGGGS